MNAEPETDSERRTQLAELPDLDPSWSRMVTATDRDGVPQTWHVLDNRVDPTAGTMLCVHGNPTWSYLWRRFVAMAPPGWRVLAVDQLGMGWSHRTATARRLSQRIDDLGVVTEALCVTGPVVTVAHDWGGPVSLGWALAHRDQLAGIILANTGVQPPTDAAPPALIRLARMPALRQTVCVRTPAFVRAASALSKPALASEVRDALASPYATAGRRQAVGDFVADIPLKPDHPSRAALETVAAGLSSLREVPALMLWGPRDPVFSDRYLRDLLNRLPQADVHRYARASHLVTEDVPEAAVDAWRWVQGALSERGATPLNPRTETTVRGTTPLNPRTDTAVRGTTPLDPRTDTAAGAPLERLPWAALTARAVDPAIAVAEVEGGRPRATSFADLARRVRDLAAGLSASGVQPGDRVALLVPPGVDLTVAVYACWRVGAVIVVADAGLGLRAMGRALRGAGPDHLIAIPKAMVAAKLLGIPGRRIVADGQPTSPGDQVAAGKHRTRWGVTSLALLEATGRSLGLPPERQTDAEAAILFTSGATGPPKGVVYRLSQLRAQLDLIASACGITPDDTMVAGFAPFALYGPALGIGAAVPNMDVTAPGTLTAAALADASSAVRATVVFASPAALRNIVATERLLAPAQREALARVRLVMSFGAPVPVSLLHDVQRVMPAAELHTPYGMTEVLPVADISLAEIEAAGPGNGVCVGWPLTTSTTGSGVLVRISPLSELAVADGELTDQPDVTGEICVAAVHVKQRYDRLWAIERESSRTAGWHRTGDVGHLDQHGRIWVEGRLVHVVTTANGPVTPVGPEQRVETLDAVRAAAVVGVGPAGTQQVVVVVVPAEPATGPGRRRGLVEGALGESVRAAAGLPVAAVLQVDALPVDIRHASKVNRTRVAAWAERVLAGGRAGRL